MGKLNFKVEGMNCKACAMLIEEELRESTGVEEAKVDFNSNRAMVIYDELIINIKEIFKMVEKLGNYSVKETSE